MNENEESEEEILSLVRSKIKFKNIAKKSKNLDIRNILMARVNYAMLINLVMIAMQIKKCTVIGLSVT